LRDGYLVALFIFDTLFFSAGWIASAYGKPVVPTMRFSGYLALLLIGVIIASYRNELRFRAELDAQNARINVSNRLEPDLFMDMRTFEALIKPKYRAEGYELKLPRPERVPLFTAEGWEPVYWTDEAGRRRRVVIGDANRVDNVPIRKKIG